MPFVQNHHFLSSEDQFLSFRFFFGSNILSLPRCDKKTHRIKELGIGFKPRQKLSKNGKFKKNPEFCRFWQNPETQKRRN